MLNLSFYMAKYISQLRIYGRESKSWKICLGHASIKNNNLMSSNYVQSGFMEHLEKSTFSASFNICKVGNCSRYYEKLTDVGSKMT